MRTDDSQEADEYNNQLLGESTLGIEVIKSSLAERCGLGNIDPQHGDGYNSSAIEEALTFSPLPPDGACFVTVRPDRDSLGAMAVLTLRAEEKTIDAKLVEWIGLMDLLGGKNAVQTHPEKAVPGYATSAMQVIIQDPLGVWPTLEEKVEEIGKILTGQTPHENLKAIAILKQQDRDGFRVEMRGPVAFVLAPGKYNQARNWGNQRYRVAVIFDPEYPAVHGTGTHTRWSVVRQDGYFDRRGFEEAINTEEARARNVPLVDLEKLGYSWGGPRNIVSSPYGRETALSKETILRIARECAESGRVS